MKRPDTLEECTLLVGELDYQRFDFVLKVVDMTAADPIMGKALAALGTTHASAMAVIDSAPCSAVTMARATGIVSRSKPQTSTSYRHW